MKKLLPIFILSFFVIVTLVVPRITLAQTLSSASSSADSRWVIDPEVTFIGKNARRAGLFLDWTIQNYNWVCVHNVSQRQCNDNNNPIQKYWSVIVLYIVVPMLFIVVLTTSIVIIITRGKSLTIMRFIPRFIAVVLLIVFSYSLIQFFYQITDLIQGFFLRSSISQPCPPNCISQADLLYVGWDYNTFVGLRLLGNQNAESAFISLLLTKITALTYFVMTFMLLIRKIILWFFIIVSPVFPILLLFYPVRNTGKIWIGEFFRWLMYAPLFAIFLNGLVFLWKNQIPLNFVPTTGTVGTTVEFPTAVNILLGGPQQYVTPTNSVNLVETFALYVVSLIMLWIVILLPWILLQIFLDYASNFASGDTAVMKTLVNMATTRPSNPQIGGPSAPKQPSDGAAISLPFSKKFSIPKDFAPQPIGAAKELNVSGATIQTNFAQPVYAPAMTANAQILNIASVKVPTMRDIARYDASMMSRDQSKMQDVSRFTQTLEKIANPVAVTNTVERNQIKEVREKIMQHSQQGNVIASSLLNAANVSSRNFSNISNQQVRESLRQIANPALSSATNRGKITKLNANLVKESQNTSNSSRSQLASSLLSVSEKTTDKEIQKIKDQLQQTSSSQLSKSVMSAVQQSSQSSTKLQSIVKQMANPGAVTNAVTRDQVVKLKESLQQASKGGNQLATSLLSVSEKTSVNEIESLQQRIQQAAEKGEPVATQIAKLADQTTTNTLPMVNRVQTVSKEDYQAVKDMWKQNYQNLEVPEGMAGNRSEWMKDDIADIDETIALLSSQDKEKVQEGMDHVSGLLPFLLVGGFSQTEIIAYLQAKQDAAKDISQVLAVDEEDQVMVHAAKTHTQQTMSASMESGNGDDESENTLSSANLNQATNDTMVSQPQISNEILAMVNVKMPKMQDIARFETSLFQKDENKRAEASHIQEVLAKIANPAPLPLLVDRAQYEKVREQLSSERQKGDSVAQGILAAAHQISGKLDILNASLSDIKEVLQMISNPSLAPIGEKRDFYDRLHTYLEPQSTKEFAREILSVTEQTTDIQIEKIKQDMLKAKTESSTIIDAITLYSEERRLSLCLQSIINSKTVISPTDKKYFLKLHDDVVSASNNGDVLAKEILTFEPKISSASLMQLRSKLKNASKTGTPFAKKILSNAGSTLLPVANTTNTVNENEYEKVKSLWEEAYRTLSVPPPFTDDLKGRREWITADKSMTTEVIGLLNSSEPEENQAGLNKVATVLPFLLLGGFSLQETLLYLDAKRSAAETVLVALVKEEEKSVLVSMLPLQQDISKTMSASIEEVKNEG
jgi:N-acetylglucosamine kinase-like BadF-type ATPase